MSIINPHKGKPHGYIQWKGTDVCIDIHCSCGESSHYDGDFMYQIECPHCNKVWECNGYILLEEPSEDLWSIQEAF